MKPLLIVISGFLAFFWANVGMAQVVPPLPTPHAARMITVLGEAQDQVAPDRAVMSVSLISKDQELNKAKQDNDALVGKLVGITQEYKIPKEKVMTSNVYIAPEYSYNNNKRQFIGYTVSRSLRITIDDISIHERLLASLVDAKIDQVNGVDFTLADPEAHAKTVRLRALENAKEKAQALAAAAGGKLGKALNITTGSALSLSPVPYPPQPMAMKAEGFSRSSNSSVAASLPGMITVSKTVVVTYELE